MKQKTARLDENQHKELKAIQERDGIPISEQLRRAVAAWIEKHKPKPEPK